MTPLLWIALVLTLAIGAMALVSFALHLASGSELWHQRAVRFFHWAALVVLATFDFTIFKHIVLTIVHW